MARRTTQQIKADDLAFPVRIKLAIPDMGLGRDMDRIHGWLGQVLGAGNYACHSAPGLGCDTIAIYFRNTEAAARFTSDFPNLPLADGTLSPAYGSPVRRR